MEKDNLKHENPTDAKPVLAVRATLKKQPKIYYVRWVLPPFRAMTIPPFGIIVRKDLKVDNQILAHDLIHWKQYERMGFFMYYFRYFMQMILIGYDTMPMEMEARRFDDEETKWNYRERYHKHDR